MDSAFAIASANDLSETVGSLTPLFSSTPKKCFKNFFSASKRRLLELVNQHENGLQQKDQQIKKLMSAMDARNNELDNYDRLLDSYMQMQSLLKEKDQEVAALKREIAVLKGDVKQREQSNNQLQEVVTKTNAQILSLRRIFKVKLSIKERERMHQDYKYRLAEMEMKSLQEDRSSLLQQVKDLKLKYNVMC